VWAIYMSEYDSRPDTDAWFAGFTDGEGHFGLYLHGRNNGWVPRFVIKLRADDESILRQLQETFGGTVIKVKRSDTSRDCALWRVLDKEGLERLVAYFDRFPLRAKKARDYKIWREAVSLYVEIGTRAPALPRLAEELRRVRDFKEAVA
jgi:hypothetical protein